MDEIEAAIRAGAISALRKRAERQAAIALVLASTFASLADELEREGQQ